MKYCCGFIFNKEKDSVLLLRKNRPQWQAGFFNGIGGKLEEGETPLQAMIREAGEETTIKDTNWLPVAVLEGKDYQVDFFAIYDQDFNSIHPLTDEQLYPMLLKDVYNPSNYFYNFIQKNLRFLIALALDTSGISKPIIYKEV